jgi:hypothetical protein
MNKQLSILSAAILLALSAGANAAVSVTNTTFNYSQTFDSLASTGTSNAWINDSTLAGWSLFNKTPAAITAYDVGTGSSNAGKFYSFGSTNSTDRALGGTASGGTYFGSPLSAAVAGWIAVAFTNTSGVALDGFTLGFDGEQWRKGGVSSSTVGGSVAQNMVLEYGFGNAFTAVSTWTAPGGNFDWSSPVFGETTGAAVNGNTDGKVAGKGGTITTAWNNNDTLWVRWIENNDANNDHGLAIDNISMSVVAAPTAPIPEADAYALMALGIGLVGFLARRRKI